MDNKDFELGQQIAELRGIVVKGFEGVHTRQDTANGRLGKLETRVHEVENKQASEDGQKKGISISWGVLLGIGGIIIAIISLLR